MSFDANGNLGGDIAASYLRGNIFINGLLFGADGDPVNHKVYVHGRFASLNTGLEPTATRISQVEALFNNAVSTFGSDISDNYCGGNNCINFNNIFTWECELTGVGSDGNACNITGDRFKYNPFIIIDTNIPTPLIDG